MDSAIPGTCSIFSIRNTPDPLKLKIRNILCLCKACILDNGQKCDNYHYADSWREVDLLPFKGKSKRSYKKCKHPNDCVTNEAREATTQEVPPCNDFNDDVPEIVIDEHTEEDFENEPLIDLTENIAANNGDLLIDVDRIDMIVTSAIPEDAPRDLVGVKIPGDGNCLCRSISQGYSGKDDMHLEI